MKTVTITRIGKLSYKQYNVVLHVEGEGVVSASTVATYAEAAQLKRAMLGK